MQNLHLSCRLHFSIMDTNFLNEYQTYSPGQQILAMVSYHVQWFFQIFQLKSIRIHLTEVAVFTLLVTYLWLKILAGIWRET